MDLSNLRRLFIKMVNFSNMFPCFAHILAFAHAIWIKNSKKKSHCFLLAYDLKCIHFPIQLIWRFFFFLSAHHLLLFTLCIFVLTMSEEVLKLLSLWSVTALWRSGTTSQVFWPKSRTYLFWKKSDISEDQAVWICFCLY